MLLFLKIIIASMLLKTINLLLINLVIILYSVFSYKSSKENIFNIFTTESYQLLIVIYTTFNLYQFSNISTNV